MGGSAGWRIAIEFGLGDPRLDQIADLQPSVCLPHSMANQIGFARVQCTGCPREMFVPFSCQQG